MLGNTAKLATLAILALTVAGSGQQDHRAKPNIAVIYIGAEDCAPCLVWRRDHWPRFAGSPDFSHLAYREVMSPKLFDLLEDSYWPEDLRQYRNRFDQSSGVPLWYIVVNGEVALTARGLREWEEAAIPKIKSFVR